ncbi:CoA ester lyase [Burkholderia cepacia]|uniref:HpcH/HpaI aldolase/citrate lyase family protein n=1 Tax=Burkholderia cepacia TaxID=292 RepID=UPI001F43F520|nr:CoA ester lyase [Burkholderia cepacia]MCE4124455.1 CoA ester lyase [Burkholderia cepacia]
MRNPRIDQSKSFLFVPGSKPERFDKAFSSNADAVIIDLEDAVSPEQKDQARNAVTDWVTANRRVIVRVNGRGTPWFERDALLGRLPGVAGIILPKAESAADVTTLVSLVKAKIRVFPLIESAQGLWNAIEIAKAPFVQKLLFGTLDFMVDMNMELANEELNTFRVQLAMASRVAGIGAPIDGVTTCLEDTEHVKRDALNGKRWGFSGKLCIHPRQVEVVNQCYVSSETEIAWAQRVIDASRDAMGAAVSVDGKMVDRPLVLHAQRILEMSGERQGIES